MNKDMTELVTSLFAVVIVVAISMVVLAGAWRVAVWILP